MQKIITATGKEYTIAWCGVSSIDNVLRFAVKNSDMATVFETFSNPNETETLTHTFDNTPKEYNGYTVFCGVALQYDNSIIVSMSKI